MPSETCAETSYRIEISGWDLDENFFVEKADLEWSESRKMVRLQHAPRKGSLVFVRLLGETHQVRAYPLAYEILEVAYQQKARTYETLLSQVHPRTRSETESAN
ncbi:MAG TPA: hypothetical protein VGZ48_02650 [Candidatus Acidoferrales bacterium]|jgi:hypothetical protein|nr:hypothetical protein [Candidatus Acidoferrales bacterium]